MLNRLTISKKYLAFILSFGLFIGGYWLSQDRSEDPLKTLLEEDHSLEDMVIGSVESLDEEDVARIYIDIKGEVHFPGVYEMEAGSRMFDAVEIAGGFTADAASDQINLSQRLSDQMMILVPNIYELPPGGFQADASWQGGQDASSQVNINTASLDELQTLSGIGPSKAQSIIQYREENGSFQRVEDLMQVSGIGEKTFLKLEDSITVGP